MVFLDNMSKYLKLMEEENIECSLVFSKSNIYYLTGYEGRGFLVVCRDDVAKLYVPILEYTRAKISVRNTNVLVKAYSKYPFKDIIIENYVREDFPSIVKKELENYKRIGLDKSITLNTYERIKEFLKDKEIIDISRHLLRLRSIKSAKEINLILKAVEITEKVLRRIIDEIHEGVSELEIVGRIEYYMRGYGASTTAFPSIVAFSENSAYPHAAPSGRKLRSSDVILIDIGARVNGYCSDMTRTFSYKYSNDTFRRQLEAVIDAQLEAIDHISPGMKAYEVDSIARERLGKEGLAKYFIHGLGHGVGVEVHEPPTLGPSSSDVLEKGMVVTIEPGIYFEGIYGIRVEDLALITSKGCRVLTRFSRMLEL